MQRLVSVISVLLLLSGCAAKKEASLTDNDLTAELKRQGLNARETARGVVVSLPFTILFAFDSADLSPEARKKLDALATVLNQQQTLSRRIAVEGHADALGSQEYNLRLSQRRADAVAQELIASQIRRERVRSQGYGEQQPVAPNTNPDGTDNPDGRAQNRRVEVVIEN
jgi:outer membrane protein OmpA-like peptidoglycan-associated protein